MAKYLSFVAVGAIAASAAFGVSARAAEIDYRDLGGEPVVLPGNPLHFFKEWGWNIELWFAFSPAKRAEVGLDIANERLAEMKKLAEKDKTEALKSAEAKYEEHMQNLKDRLSELGDNNKNTVRLAEKLTEIADKHRKVFDEIKSNGDANEDDLKPSEEAVTEVIRTAIEKLGANASSTLENFVQGEAEGEESMRQDEASSDDELQRDINEKLDELKDLYERSRGRRGGDDRQENASSTTDRPETVCSQQFDPVCGKDGRTYSNSCVARARGVEIARNGECQDRGSGNENQAD